MLHSKPRYDRRIRRRRVAAWLDARSAVHDGVSPEEYARYRYGVYQAHGRRTPYPLPFVLSLGPHGKMTVIWNPDYDAAWQELSEGAASEDAMERFLLRSESQEIAREVQRLEEEEAQQQAALLDVREQSEAIEAVHDAALAQGNVLGPTTKKRRPSHRGRPCLPLPWQSLLIWLAIIAMALFEAAQFAVPFWDAIGVDAANLSTEWGTNPMGVLAGAGFALTVVVAVFILCYLTLRCATSIPRHWGFESPTTTVMRAVGAASLGLLLLGLIYVMAEMRHDVAKRATDYLTTQQGQVSGTHLNQTAFFFLALVVPWAAAYLHWRCGASDIWGRRTAIRTQQRQWDEAEQHRMLAEDRLTDRRGSRERKIVGIERQLERLRRGRRALARRAQAAERRRLARLDEARRRTEAYAHSQLAALERDHYYYLRAARTCLAHQRHGVARTSPAQEFHGLLPAGNQNGSVS